MRLHHWLRQFWRRSVRAKRTLPPRRPDENLIRLFVTPLEPRVVLNAAPFNLDLSQLHVSEAAAAGDLVGRLSSATIDPSTDGLSFQLLDDANGRFEITNSNELHVKTDAAFDFETAAFHDVVIEARDTASLKHDQTFRIDVLDAPESVQIDATFWSDDGITLSVDDGLLHVRQTDTTTDLIAPHAIESVTDIVVTGRDGNADDMLTVDLSNGEIPAIIQFDGGLGGFDTLKFTGTAADRITYQFDNASDGAVQIGDTQIRYVGLEPIQQTMTAADVVLQYGDASEVITVDATSTFGQTIVTSTSGESVVFDNPTSSLTILAGGGDDIVQVNRFAGLTGLDAAFHVDGEAGADRIFVNTGLGLPADHDVSLSAETIQINASVSVHGNGAVALTALDSTGAAGHVTVLGPIDSQTGDISVIADGDIELGPSSHIVTTGGAITLHADADGTGVGRLALSTTSIVRSNGEEIHLVAAAADLAGVIDNDTGTVVIADSSGRGIGLGTGTPPDALALAGAELATISASTLRLQSAGPMIVDGVAATDVSGVTGAVILSSDRTVSFTGNGSTFGNLQIEASDGVIVDASLTAETGNIVINADTDPGDDVGTLAVAAGVEIGTQGGVISVTANDINLAGRLNGGTLRTAIVDSDGSGIGLGMTLLSGGLNLSGAELANISGIELTLRTESIITVDGITASDSDGITGLLVLDAVEEISFINHASTFNSVDVQSDGRVDVTVGLSTDRGVLRISSDTDNVAGTGDDLHFSNGVTLQSAANQVLQTSGGEALQSRAHMTADGVLTLLAADGILLNNSLTTNGLTTVNTDTDGDGEGDLLFAAGIDLTTQNHRLDITANDIRAASPFYMAFQDGVFPSDSYAGTEDTMIRWHAATTPLGNAEELEVVGLADSSALLRWDISSLPVGATVVEATLTLSVTEGSDAFYNVQQLKPPWTEAETTYIEYAPGQRWGLPGAYGLIHDIYGESLGFIGGQALGTTEFMLNDVAVDAVQSWVTDPSVNQGIKISNAATPHSFRFASSETAVATNRPKLTIGYLPDGFDLTTLANLDSGTAKTVITDSDGDGIGLGVTVPGGLNLSAGELQGITASELSLNTTGSIAVGGISDENSDKITGPITLNSGNQVIFQNAASTFNSLTITAEDGVAILADLTVQTGDLLVDANADHQNDAGEVEIRSFTAVTTNDNDVSINARDVAIFGSLNAGAGNIAIQDDTGNGVALGRFHIEGGPDISGSEIRSMTAATLTITTAGWIDLDGLSSVDTAGIAGVTTLESDSFIIAHRSSSTFHSLVMKAADGVIVGINLTADSGPILIDADTNGDGGTLAISAFNRLFSNTGGIALRASDLNVRGTIDSNGAPVRIDESRGNGISLGTAAIPATMQIASDELQQILASDLLLKTPGDISAAGVQPDSTAGIANDIQLEAGHDIRFVDNASTFENLEALANNRVFLGTGLSTRSGDLVLTSDANGTVDGEDDIFFADNAWIDSAAALMLNAPDHGMHAQGTVILNAAGSITVNGDLSADGAVTIAADTDGDANGDLLLTADTVIATADATLHLTLHDLVLAPGAGTNSGTGDTTVETSTTVDIGLGSGIVTVLDNPLLIDSAELSALKTTGMLTIGSPQTGRIVVRDVDVGPTSVKLVSANGLDDETEDTASFTTTGTLTLETRGTVGDAAISGTQGLNVDVGGLTVHAHGDSNVTATDMGSSDTTYQITHDGAATIAVTQNANNLLIQQIDANMASITLTASTGAIQDALADATVDVTSESLELTAQTGIGAHNALELSAASITADSASGAIRLTNVALTPTVVHSVTTGTGEIQFDQSGGESLTIARAETTDGSVQITNVGDASDDALTVTEATAGGANQDITLFTIDHGDVVLGVVTAAQGRVLIDAANAIVDGRVAEGIGGENIVANAARLQATTGVGSGDWGGDGDIDTQVGVLAAVTDSGDVSVHDAGGLQIGAVDALHGIAILDSSDDNSGGDRVVLGTTGPLLLADRVANEDGGTITLIAEGDSAAELLTIAADVAITGNNGDLRAVSGGTLELTSGTLSTQDDGTITLIAGRNETTGGSTAGSSAADIRLADTSRVMTDTGSIELRATGDIVLSQLQTGGAVIVSADDDSNGAADGVGAIHDGLSTEAANIVAASINFNAADGVGAGVRGDATDIDVVANRVAAVNTGAADINLSNTSASAVEIAGLTTVGGSVAFDQSGSGLLTITGVVSTGSVTVDGGNIQIAADDAMVVDAVLSSAGGAGGVLKVDGGVTLNAAPVVGSGNITLSSGDLDIVVTADLIGPASIELNAPRDIIIQARVQTTTGDDVVLTADTDDDGVGGVWIQSSGQVGTGRDAIISGADLFATPNAVDTVRVDSDVTDQVIAQRNIAFTPRPMTPFGADMIVDGDIRASGDVTVVSVGGIQGQGSVTADQVILDASTGIGSPAPFVLSAGTIRATTTTGDVVVDNQATASVTVTSLTTDTGNITFLQHGGQAVRVESATTGDGSIRLSNTGQNSTDVLDVVAITAGGSGDIVLTTLTSGDIVLGSITAASDAIQVDSADAINARAAIDGQPDLLADQIELLAVGGIGNDQTVELRAVSFSADTTDGDISLESLSDAAVTVTSMTTGVGAITLDQTGGHSLTVDVARTTDGAVSVTNHGDSNDDGLSVGVAEAGGVTRDVILTTVDFGDVSVGSVKAMDDGIVITSAGAINEDAAEDVDADVEAAVVTLDAVTGIGETHDLELTADRVTAATVNGNVNLNSLAMTAVVVDRLATETGTIRFAQTGDQALRVASATTVDGSIHIANTGDAASDTLQAVFADAGGTGNVQLTTFIAGDVELGHVTALDDEVHVTAASAINELATADSTADVTADAVVLNASSGIGNQSDLELTATTLSADSDQGGIRLNSLATTTVTVQSLTTGTGEIELIQTGNESLVIQSARTLDGSITVSNTGDETTDRLEVTALSAGGTGRDVHLSQVTAGTVVVGSVEAIGDTMAITSAGAINEDSAGDPATDLLAATLNLSGTLGIGNVAPLEIDATTIVADSTNGDITLNSLADSVVTVTQLETGVGNVTFAQQGNGDVTLVQLTTGDGDISVSSQTSTIHLTGTVTAGGDGDAAYTTNQTGDVELTGTTTADGNAVTIQSAGAVNGAGLITADSVSTNATTGIGNVTALQLTVSNVALQTTGGNVVADNAIGTNVTVTELATTGGHLTFNQTGGGGVTFAGPVTSGDATHVGGDILLTSSAGLTVASTATLSSAIGTGGIFKVTRATVDTAPTIGAGNITIQGGELDAIITADISSTTTIVLDAPRDIIIKALVQTVSDDADIQFAADTDDDGVGGVWIQTAGQVIAGRAVLMEGADLYATDTAVDTIRVDADGVATQVEARTDITLQTRSKTPGDADMVINGVMTAGDTLSIAAKSAITGTGLMTSDRAVLTAAAGIGAVTPIELSATTIQATTTTGDIGANNTATQAVTLEGLTTTSGGLSFHQTGQQTLTVTDAATDDGSITIDNDAADITASSIVARGVAPSVTLQTLTAGDVFVNRVDADTGDVMILSRGVIEETNPTDATADIVASSIMLQADSGIGTRDPIELTGAVITATSTNGDIRLNSLATESVLTPLLATGVGNIAFAQTGNESLTVALTTTIDGTIAVTNTGDSDIDELEVLNATAGGDGDVELTTIAAGDLLVGEIHADSNQVQLVSASELNSRWISDAIPDVVADRIALKSVRGIGTVGPIEIRGGTVLANTANGVIALHSLADTAVTATGLTTGVGDVLFEQSGGHSLTVDFALTDDGSISILNNGDSPDDVLQAISVEAGGANRGVELTTVGAGDIEIDSVAAIDDQVTVRSAGAILDASFGDASGVGNISAHAVVLRAVSGIGNGDADTGSDFDTDVTILAASTESGDINVENAGALTVGDVDGLSGVTIVDSVDDNSAADGLSIRAHGPIDVTESVSNHDGGGVLLAAEGRADVDAVTLDASISTTGSDGDIQIVAGGDVVQRSGHVSAAGNGDVTLNAGVDWAGGTPLPGNATADVRMMDGTSISTSTGTISLRASDTVRLTRLMTRGDVLIVADDAAFGLSDGTGGIREVTSDETVNIEASSVVLQAATGIGAGSRGDAGDLDMTTADVSAINAATGGINLSNTSSDPLQVMRLTTSRGSIAADQTGGGDIQLKGRVESGGRDIELVSANGISMRRGATIDAAAGSIVLDAGGSAWLGAVTSESAVSITARRSVIESSPAAGGADIAASTLTLSANGAIGSLTPLAVTARSIQASSTTGTMDLQSRSDQVVTVSGLTAVGDIRLQHSGPASIVFDGPVTSTAAGVPSGDVTLTADTDVTLDTDVLSSTAHIQSAGGIGGTGRITAVDVELDAVTGIGDALTPFRLATSGLAADTLTGDIRLANESTGPVDVTSFTTVGGDIRFEQSSGSLTFSGPVRSGSATVDGGEIYLAGTDTVTVADTATIASTSGSGGALTIQGVRVLGSIHLGAGDITILGAGKDTIIDRDIISDDPISISAEVDIIVRALVKTNTAVDINLSADSDGDGVGGVWVQTAGAIDSGHDVFLTGSDVNATPGVVDSVRIDTDAGHAQVAAADSVTVAAGAAAPANALLAVDGNITAAQDVTLFATGSIEGAGTISSTVARMDSATGIGVVSPLHLSVGTLNADAGTGEIQLENAATGTVTLESLATQGGNVRLIQTGGDLDIVGSISSGDATTPGGDIAIATDAVLTVSNAAVVSSASGAGGSLTIERARIFGDVTIGSGDVTLSGAGDDVVIGVDLVSDDSITIIAPVDIIVQATVKTTGPDTDIRLRADSDDNGEGGVWIQDSGAIQARRDATIVGADLFVTANAIDSIKVDADGVNWQVEAGRNIEFLAGPAAKSNADILLDGVVKSPDRLTIDAAGAVEGQGTLDALNIQLTGGTGIGQNTPLQLLTKTLTARTDTGNIGIVNAASGLVEVVDLSTVGGSVSFEQTGAGDVVVSGRVTSGDASTPGGGISFLASQAMTIQAGSVLSTATGTGGGLIVRGVTVEGDVTVGAGDVSLLAASDDTVIDVDIISNKPIDISAPVDIIVRATIQTLAADSDVILTADADANGTGGVWVQTTGQINSARDVVLSGSDLAATPLAVDSVVVDADTASTQITADRDIRLAFGTAAPSGADILTRGDLTATGDVMIQSIGTINGSGRIAAQAVTLDAAGGIGDSEAIQLSTTRLAAHTGHGTIDIDNSSAETVTVTELTTVGGDIAFDHDGGGDLQFTGLVSSGDDITDGGSINLTATETLTVAETARISSSAGTGGDLTIRRAIVRGTLDAGTGDITISGGGKNAVVDTPIISDQSIIIEAPEDIIVGSLLRTRSADGDIILTADSDRNQSGGVWIQEAGEVDSGRDVVATGSSLATETGIADVDARAHVALFVQADGGNTQLFAEGDMRLGTGPSAPAPADVLIAGLVESTAGTLRVVATGVVDAGGTLIAPITRLASGGGIGIDNTLHVVTTTLEAVSDAGDIVLDLPSANDVNVERLQTVGGNIQVVQTGMFDLAIVGDVSSGSDHVDGGDIEIRSDGMILVNGRISSASGSGGTLTVSGVGMNVSPIVGAGNILLNGGSGDTIIGIDQISATTIVITALRDIIVGALIQTTEPGADILLIADSDANGVGGVLIKGEGEVDAFANTQIVGSDLFATTGAIDSVVVAADSIDSAGHNQVRAGGSVTLQSAAHTATPRNADVVVNGRIESQDGVNITAMNDVRFGVDGDILSHSGGVRVTADVAEGVSNGRVQMAAGAVLDSGAAPINIVADGAVTVGQFATSYAGPEMAISITSENGAINSAVDSAETEILASGPASRVVLNAETGIGSTAALDVSAASLTARSVNGDISLRSRFPSTVAINEIVTGDGSIALTQTGGTALQIGAVGTSQGDIHLSVDGADLIVNGRVQPGGSGTTVLSVSGTGDVVLNGPVDASGDVIEISSDAGAIRGSSTVTAHGLMLYAAAGIGNATPLNTSVDVIAAANTESGLLRINNDAGGALAIGDVGSLSGIENSGTASGPRDLIVTNAGRLDVNRPVINTTGGDIQLNALSAGGRVGHLTLSGNVAASGGNGSIFLNADGNLTINDTSALVSMPRLAALSSDRPDVAVAGNGRIVGTAGGQVRFGGDVIVATETGAVTDVPPSLQDVTVDSDTNLQTRVTSATLSGSFGRTNERGFSLRVDWGDGTVETMQSSLPNTFSFTHDYQMASSTAIPVSVTLASDRSISFGNDSVTVLTEVDPSIFVQLETDDTDSDQEDVSTALLAALELEESVRAREHIELAEESRKTTPIETTTVEVETVQVDTTDLSVRQIYLFVISPSGQIVDTVSLNDTVLDDLPALFTKLPDGRYRIMMREAGEQRMRLLIEVDVRDGRATDVTDHAPASDADDARATPAAASTDVTEAIVVSHHAVTNPRILDTVSFSSPIDSSITHQNRSDVVPPVHSDASLSSGKLSPSESSVHGEDQPADTATDDQGSASSLQATTAVAAITTASIGSYSWRRSRLNRSTRSRSRYSKASRLCRKLRK